MSIILLALNKLSLELSHKILFEGFSANLYHGNKIAIIGNNGSGKSSLLKLICEQAKNSKIAYVPQIIEEFPSSSGGEKFNKSLSLALSKEPEILFLDEPTNNLDSKNRKSLINMIKNFPGTIILVTHDLELLNNAINIIWHIEEGLVKVFAGNYNNYQKESNLKRISLEAEVRDLEKQKNNFHESLMKEQQRAKKSKAKGQKSIDNRKWPTITSKTKALNAQKTSGKNQLAIKNRKEAISKELDNLHLAEILKPKFIIPSSYISSGPVLEIINGEIGYNEVLQKNININLAYGEKLVIKGKNASGKSTVIKALLGNEEVRKTGKWYLSKEYGYLDQNYNNINLNLAVIENLKSVVPSWDMLKLRNHLNDFLFRKTEQVNLKAIHLSGGEKVRLCLALIAAKAPKILILDEITNNLDLQTKEHVVQILSQFSGSFVIISHEEKFLEQLNIDKELNLSTLEKC